jgi:UDP-2,3-diacylglucosamine pyrophosphatase LpxH
MADQQLADGILAAAAVTPKPAADAEQVTQRREGDVVEARSTSRRIKTVEDLLAHIEADLARYEVAASEATKWEVGAADGEGGVSVTELHRVWVRLKPKAGPSVKECVEAMIEAANLPRAKERPVETKPRGDLWAVLVIADCHFGKYAWGKTTGGGDYDLDIASRLVDSSARQLIDISDSYEPSRRTILFLGDLFHYDTPHGSTTSGTPLERDGRMPKMIKVGCDALLGVVERSAETRPTDVHVVSGNHDEALTFAFQRILQERFRNDGRVAVAEGVASRQYLSHGNNLLGIAHGNRAKKRLPQIMALEAADKWARCRYREYHTGHYHSQAAEWQRPIETIDGVIVRTAPAICPPDDWHAQSGFIGSRQAMECFIYRPEGGLSAMHVAGPTQ